MHNNRSVPSLPSQHHPGSDDNTEPVPPMPPAYDPTAALHSFHALRITDPVPRASSVASESNRSYHSALSSPGPPHPPVVNGLPSRPNPGRPPIHPSGVQGAPSLYRNQSLNNNGAYPDGGPDLQRDPAYDNDQASVYYRDDASSIHSGYTPPPNAGLVYGQPQRYGPVPVQSMGGRPGEYNVLYAAASDVLGVGLPPGAPGSSHFLPSDQAMDYQYAQSTLSLTSSHSVPAMASSQTSHSSGSAPSINSQVPYSPTSIASAPVQDDVDFEGRPSFQRSGTAATVNLRTQKTKAVDLRAPPYTKQYIDDYRQRIKADPDPEAHFAYARYLIDAAKKIGADAKDQRAVRKYRDTLIQESLKVIRRLATQGQPFHDAQFFLANCYGTGMLGLQVDHEKAYHLYLQAAKQNHPAATYRVAVCNEIGAGTRKEPPRAAAFYRKAASLGDTPAMYKLGMILLQGTLGEARNPREAVGWLRRAAEQADEEYPHALHELALLHENPNSQIVAYDPIQARELYSRAAYLGYTQSQYKLGQCYEYGALGCPVDPRRSIAWYTKAAEKGNSEAELALSGWYLTGSEGVLKQSDSEAYLWARRAANKGLSKAEYAVGYYAEVGIGIKQDVDFAKRWYMRAAAQGNKRAMNRLTEMKRQGTKRANMARPTRQQAESECVIT
ncbi:hypothetical protein OF83DRAFT_1124881 [Amylostereum chailletii]|nr:hypothetical protein OF83DRAFT_1124881 [Amylostereum chailletii]